MRRNEDEHSSALRELLAQAHGVEYRSYRSLAEVRTDPGGAVIFQGDDGGQIYATAPASVVGCTERRLNRLLRDLDRIGWRDMTGASINYEHAPVGHGISGGMDGGLIDTGVWVHPRLADLGLTPGITAVITGQLARLSRTDRQQRMP